MKTLIKLFVFAFLIASFSSCYFQPYGHIIGSGPIVTEEFTVAEFNSVAGETVIDIDIVQGDVQSVIAEGHENIMSFLELKVINGRLIVDLKNGSYSNFQMKIFVTVPELESVEVGSTGNITVEEFSPMQYFDLTSNSTGNIVCYGQFNITEELSIRSSSTGNISINADAFEVNVKQSSTGNVKITGTCEKQWVDISSTGNYNAYELMSKECRVETSSTGDAHVYVTDYLNAIISSTGSVFFKGNPVVNVSDTSVGNLVRVN
ncbi:MAG: DUF2807 domain-containing protein [Prolixibacteraceae bacterium]|nr:DUF2807 domain-containing protein [Prolixibacteraceae bacterium]